MADCGGHKPRWGQHFALICETITYTEADKSCQDGFMLNLSSVKYSLVTRRFTQAKSQDHNIVMWKFRYAKHRENHGENLAKAVCRIVSANKISSLFLLLSPPLFTP